MGQVAQNFQALLNDAVAFAAFYIRNKPNTTAIVFIFRVIKPLAGWQAALIHVQPLSCFFQ
jgi:hypothetical protein